MKRFISVLFLVSIISSLWGQTYKIGDLVINEDGSKGIVFYVTQDRTDGWMVALNDLPTQSWGLSNDIPSLQNLDGFIPLLNETDGYSNTGIIRQYHESLGYSQFYGAGSVDYENGWYIPTAGQLMKLCSALSTIDSKITQAGGSTMQQQAYFSSTEAPNYELVWSVDFGNYYHDWGGLFNATSKSGQSCLRAVRNIQFHQPLPDPNFPDNILDSDCNNNTPIPFEGGQLMYQTSSNVNVYSTPLCGDIDGDGIVDIVVAQYTAVDEDYRIWSNKLGIYNGNDLSLQNTISIPQEVYLTYTPLGIVRYPLDNGEMQGAIIALCNDGKLRSYTKSGQLLHTADIDPPCDGSPAFADFNNDGYPEIYIGNAIYDAATLKWLCSGPENGNKGLSFRGSPNTVFPHHSNYALSYAYNILGNEKLELVCGNTIYNVNIVSRTNPALNSVTENKTATPPSGFPQDGQVAIADLDLDGQV